MSANQYGPDTQQLLDLIKEAKESGNSYIEIESLNITSLPYKELDSFSEMSLVDLKITDFDDRNFKKYKRSIDIDTCSELKTVNFSYIIPDTISITSCKNLSKAIVFAKDDIELVGLPKLVWIYIPFRITKPDTQEGLIKSIYLSNLPELLRLQFLEEGRKRSYVYGTVTIDTAHKLTDRHIEFKSPFHEDPRYRGNWFGSRDYPHNADLPEPTVRLPPRIFDDEEDDDDDESGSEYGLDTYSDLESRPATPPIREGELSPPPTPRRNREQRHIPAFAREYESVDLEEGELIFDGQTAYDFLELEDISILSHISKRDRILIKIKDTLYPFYLKFFIESKTGKNVVYECKVYKELGTANSDEVNMDTPYFNITTGGNYLVRYEEMEEAINSYQIIELIENEGELKNTIGENNIIIPNQDENIHGEDINIMSADHCQAKSNKKTYKIKALILNTKKQEEKGGRKTTKSKKQPINRTRKLKKLSKE